MWTNYCKEKLLETKYYDIIALLQNYLKLFKIIMES